MPTKIFTRDELTDMLWAESETLTKVQDTLIDESRWSMVHKVIFREGDKFYSSIYSTGKTEMQEERPWDDEDEVECTEVKAVEKTIITYEIV